MTKHPHYKAHLALITTNFLFGANFSVVKSITPSVIAPFALNILRASSTCALFWIMFTMSSNVKAGFFRKDLWLFIVCAATGVTFNQLLFIKGLSLSTGIHGALLMLVTPIFITVIAAMFLKERLNAYKIGGLISGISGATFLILSKDTSATGIDVVTGDILIAINAVFYAVYMVMVKPLMKHYSPLHVIRWVFTFGMLMMFPFSWNDLSQTDFSTFTLNHWLAIVFVLICGTFLPYMFNVYALSKLHASVAGAYMYTQPVFATVIAIIFLGESFDWVKAVCGLLIFGGVYLTNLRVKEKEASQA